MLAIDIAAYEAMSKHCEEGINKESVVQRREINGVAGSPTHRLLVNGSNHQGCPKRMISMEITGEPQMAQPQTRRLIVRGSKHKNYVSG